MAFKIGTNGTFSDNPVIADLTWDGYASICHRKRLRGTQSAQGWMHDTDHLSNPANTSSYKNMIKTQYYAACDFSPILERHVRVYSSVIIC
jgi:hypothetical protein